MKSPELRKPHSAASRALLTQHFPCLGAGDLQESHRLHLQRCSCLESRAHLNRENLGFPSPYFVLAFAMTDGHCHILKSGTASGVFIESKVGAYESPPNAAGVGSQDFAFGPSVAAALPSLNSDSDFCDPVLKPPLKRGGNQGKKRHCNRQVSLTLGHSGCNGCNDLSFVTRQSYTWNKCCSPSRYPLVAMMLTALRRLIGYLEVPP